MIAIILIIIILRFVSLLMWIEVFGNKFKESVNKIFHINPEETWWYVSWSIIYLFKKKDKQQEIQDLIENEKTKGYSDDNAGAKVCQDLILKAISVSPLKRKVTIKGGVIMRDKTQNIRRATQDLDIDFIKYSLSSDSIDEFINKLISIERIKFKRIGAIEELNQQDYHGKRVFIQIEDSLEIH